MTRILALCLLLVACADDPVASPCAEGCNDGDRCTLDKCFEGRCIFIPVGAENACRNDGHCDDGIECSIDRCAIDDCGFQRCASEFPEGCAPCSFAAMCEDFDACTLDVCNGGTCWHHESPWCDRTCDQGTPPPDGLERAFGRIGAGAPCACPCTTPIALDQRELTLDPPGSCTRTCSEGVEQISCAPLPLGSLWLMHGHASGPAFVAESWCMHPGSLSEELIEWRGAITWTEPAGLAPTTFTLRTSFGGSIQVYQVECGSCGVTLDEQDAFFEMFGAFESVATLTTFHEGLPRNLRLVVYPTQTGFIGPIHSTDDALDPIQGVMTLTHPELEP